jgi:hypothetical protein
MTTRKFKLLFSLLGVLVTSTAFPQTAARTVMVQSNNAALLYPTNFWSANAAQARTGLGLGSAATNPASAFQPSSTVLSNLAAGQGLGVTNITGTLSVVSGGTGATNAGAARTNLGLGATWLTNTDSSFFRSAIGIQNQEWLTNTSTFYVPISFGGDALGNASATRTNLGLGATWLTNTNVTNFRTAIGLGVSDSVAFAEVVASTALEAGSSSNTIIIDGDGIIFGHSGIAATTRTNLGLGATWLTNTNVTNFRSAIGLGTNAQPVFDGLTILADLFAGSLEVAAGSNGTTVASDGIQFTGISAATTRTNLGLGATWLTNTNVANFRTAIGLGATNTPVFAGVSFGGGDLSISNEAILWSGVIRYEPETQTFSGDVQVENGAISIVGTNAVLKTATTRTNLGLPWNGLTNTNAAGFRNVLEIGTTNTLTIAGITAQNITVTAGGGIALQSVITNAASFRTNIGLPWSALTNTNAINFREAAGMRIVQNVTNIVTSGTNTVTNGLEVVVYSIAPTVGGVTNTLTLPVGASTAQGDRVVVVHTGPTNSATAVRSSGATNNLATLNQTDSSLSFIYRDTSWLLVDRVLTTSSTNTAPANTTNVVGWFEIRIGTNSYRTPLYQ